MFLVKPRLFSLIATLSLPIVLLLDTVSTAQPYTFVSSTRQTQSALKEYEHPQQQNSGHYGSEYGSEYSSGRNSGHHNVDHNHNRRPRQTSVRGELGASGRDGRAGRNGRAGTTPNSSSIRVFDTASMAPAQSYQFLGTNGEDGSDGDNGEHARRCHLSYHSEYSHSDYAHSDHAYSNYSLTGADGGDGGHGGDGGNGGNGGDVSIYYTSPEQLNNIVIEASGGQGGRPGQGGDGGEGCECTHNEYYYSEHPEHSEHSHVDYVRCQNGDLGQAGQTGHYGFPGDYGQFRLIPGEVIPTERVLHAGRIGDLVGQTTELVKNVWVERQDLRALLHPASDVPSSYTYLQSTERPRYRIEWAAAASPADLGLEDVAISASIALNGIQAQLTYLIPDTLDYTITSQSNIDVITITGGSSPETAASFRAVVSE